MGVTRTTILFGILTAGALGGLASEVLADLAAKSMLRETLARHQGLIVATIGVEPWAGNLVLRRVRTRVGGVPVSIGTLRLPIHGLGPVTSARAAASETQTAPAGPSPTPPQPAPAAPGSVSADNVVVTSGPTTYRIKHIEMAGTSLSNGDLAALLDATTPGSLEVRLRRFKAAAIVIPEVAADDPTAGSERHGLVKQILLANVSAGKAAAGSAAETTFAIKDGQEAINGRTGAIEAAGLDLAQVAHVLSTTRVDDNEPILPLYDTLVVNALDVANVTRNSRISMTSLKQTAGKGRALKTDISAAGAAATQAGPTVPTDAKSAALFDDVAHSFVVGSLEVNDLASHNDSPDGATSFVASEVAIQDFADRKIGGMTVRGFRLDSPDAKFALATLDVGPFVIPPPQVSSAVAATSKTMVPPGKLEMGGVDVDVISRQKEKPDTATEIRFKVGHIGFASDGHPNEIPPKALFAFDGLSFDVPPNSASTQALYDMGYRNVNLSGTIASAYDADNQDLKVRDLSVDGANMGSIGLSLHLLNVTKGLLSSNQQIATASAMSVLAKAVDLKIANAGLFQKAIELKARRDGMTVADERDFGVDFFANKLPASLNDNAGAKTIGDAVAKFIADPRNLHISIESKEGLGVASMGLLTDPGALLDTLDIHASADE